MLLASAAPAFAIIENFATTKYLGSITYCLFLLILITNITQASNNLKVNPYSVFSFMYFGFVISGTYFAFSDGDFGKFLGFTNIQRSSIELYLVYSQIYAVICYAFFYTGYSLAAKKNLYLPLNGRNEIDLFIKKYYKIISFPLMAFGFSYWLWVTHTITGGIIESFVLFQIFPHIIREAEISTLPYQLYYAGIYVWLIGLVVSKRKISTVFWIFAIIGVAISISTARIAISATFLLSILYMIYLVRPDIRGRIINAFLAVIIFSFIAFFLRMASNLFFLGREFNFDSINIGEIIIGGGNVADLQQIAIIFYLFENRAIGMGITYFDWLRNTFGWIFNLSPSSVGLIIREKIVIGESGAPTPSAIGEAYFNFSIAAPFFIYIVGFIFALINNSAFKSRSALAVLIFAIFVTHFIFLYPKVDSTMFANFFWRFAPLLSVVITTFLIFKLLKQSSKKSSFNAPANVKLGKLCKSMPHEGLA